MSHKNQNTSTVTDKLNTTAMQAGLILMTAAATLGMIELPEHPNKVATLNVQPAFVVATPAIDHSEANTIRKEREETHPHHLSFSTTQRTHARAGRA